MTVIEDNSFDPLFSFRFTPLGFLVTAGALSLLLIAGVTVLIAFTGLREYIPGYPTGEERLVFMHNLQRADSLAREVQLRDNMLTNLRSVLRGDVDVADSKIKSDAGNAVLTAQSLAKLNEAKSQAVSEFVSEVESAEKYDVESEETPAAAAVKSELESTFFFTPVKGIVTDRFGAKDGHNGIDVSAPEGTAVLSTLAGTVIFSEWTVQTGHVIMVQHDNQLVSVYKHNSRLLKGEGAKVNAGEAIAMVGNSGEFSTGTHLHFELWYLGSPLNPEDYISFEEERAQ